MRWNRDEVVVEVRKRERSGCEKKEEENLRDRRRS
jgi:hypothetical protein